MGFERIPELRDLLEKIPTRVLTPTQRLTLWTINSYSKDDEPNGACWIGLERLAKQVGVGKRGLYKVLHELGDGLNCAEHPGDFHLDFIRRHEKKARKGVAQSYSIKFRSMKSFVSMHSGSPSKSESVNTYDLQHELKSTRARTEVHPYIHNKHNKHLQNDFYIKQIIEFIPKEKRNKITSYDTLDDLITQYRDQGGMGQHLVDMLNGTQWDQIHSPAQYLVSQAKKAIESFIPTPIPGRFRAEDFQ